MNQTQNVMHGAKVLISITVIVDYWNIVKLGCRTKDCITDNIYGDF